MSDAPADPPPEGPSRPSGTRQPDTSKLTVASQRVSIDRDLTAPPTAFERGLYAVAWWLLVGLARVFFRLRVEGREHVPADRPFILAPVHRSYLDFALVVACCSARRRMRYLGKDTLWKGSLGRLWTALGAIPVHRGSTDRAALATCIGVIEAGEPLVMFPEGTRQEGPDLHPLFDGPAFVQSRTGAPIVPVGIGGSAAAMPKGSKFPRPRRLTIVIGEPIEPADAGPNGRVGRHAVKEQTARLAESVQALFDEAQQLAGTPNRR
jgi:1-acyl-sn-glycerol-3-phosphate acyltransferase